MQFLAISLLILSSLLSNKFFDNNDRSDTYFNNPIFDSDILNNDEKPIEEQNEDPPIKLQPTLQAAEKQSIENLLAETSYLDGSYSAMEARLLRLLESAEELTVNFDYIGQKEEERQKNVRDDSDRDSEGTISIPVLCLLIFVSGALSVSVYKNIKLLKRSKEVESESRPKERQSEGTQTQFYRLEAREDEISDISDDSSSLGSYVDKKAKKKRFGYSIRKCFLHCLKRKRKKHLSSQYEEIQNNILTVQNEISVESLHVSEQSTDEHSSAIQEISIETSFETVTYDEPKTVPTRGKKKHVRNLMICCKKCKTLEVEDSEADKGEDKPLKLKTGNYFCHYKQAKKYRKEKYRKCKKWFWQWCHEKASEEEEEEESVYETLEESEARNDEVLDVIAESSDEASTVSSDITDEASTISSDIPDEASTSGEGRSTGVIRNPRVRERRDGPTYNIGVEKTTGVRERREEDTSERTTIGMRQKDNWYEAENYWLRPEG
ncbi:hypothetical protein XENTR_v10022419 [Xenopus tropicalis]|nr:hypothetical protein XENTR_v10022419 [Xenopus tropicalis]